MNAVPTNAPVTVAQIAIGILAKRGTPMHWRDLVDAVIAARGPVAAGADRSKIVASVYTDINLDNRFNYLNDGLWGLREWAPKGQPAKAVPLAASLRGRREKVQREEEVFAVDEDDEEATDADGEAPRRDEEAAEEEWEEPEER